RVAYNATKEEQIAVAERVLANQGKGAWPSCGGPLSGHTPRNVVDEPEPEALDAPAPGQELPPPPPPNPFAPPPPVNPFAPPPPPSAGAPVDTLAAPAPMNAPLPPPPPAGAP